MANLVFLVGRSGMGKSTSLRNLNPDETVIINTDQKALPFKQFALNYNAEKKNYRKTSDISLVLSTLKKVNENTNIKTVVIDTWSRIMTDAIMNPTFRNASGFSKWGDMSGAQYDLINYINDGMRDDMIVYLLAHPETHYDESGFPSERIAVQGKQLEKFVPESFSTVVLYVEVMKIAGQPNRHVFRTVSSGTDTCKTPLEMFPEKEIDNDLVIVNQTIREYYGI